MSAKVLVDTNVLVYSYDRTAGEKQTRALDILEHLVTTGRGLLSVQVLAEFFCVVTRKLADPLHLDEAERQIHAYLKVWPVTEITPLILVEATRGAREHRMSYWDAQLWATALLSQTPIILSEDFKDGTTVEGIQFLNPFSRRFNIAHLESLR